MDENLTELAVSSETPVNPAGKTFTQEEFDAKLSKRVNKESSWFLTKLGIEKKEDLDGIVEKLEKLEKYKDYDELRTQNESLQNLVNSLQAEKSKTQYMRAIEKADVDEEVMELVYTKVTPNKDEKVEDYTKRVQDYLKSHPNFIKGTTSTISTSVDLTGKTTNLGDTNKRMNDFIRKRKE